MLDATRLEELAAAVADGQAADWALAEADLEQSDRETVAKLRAIASIGHVFSSLSSDGVRLPPVRAVLSSGDTWGSLRILQHVGRGRFGEVYRAWDPALDREVALKLIEHADAGGSQVVHEGRLMARVHHPNVISIFGAHRIGTVTGLWMQFVRGRTLADELAERGPFAADDLVRVGQALCAPEPVGVQQCRRPAGPADRQSAAQVQLDEAVADAQHAERLELRCCIQGRRGLDLLGGGQD